MLHLLSVKTCSTAFFHQTYPFAPAKDQTTILKRYNLNLSLIFIFYFQIIGFILEKMVPASNNLSIMTQLKLVDRQIMNYKVVVQWSHAFLLSYCVQLFVHDLSKEIFIL